MRRYPDLDLEPLEIGVEPLLRTEKGNIAWSRNLAPCGEPLDKVLSALRKTIRAGNMESRFWALQLYLVSSEAHMMLWQELQDAVMDDIDQVDHPVALGVVRSHKEAFDQALTRSNETRGLILDSAVRYLTYCRKSANGLDYVLNLLYKTQTEGWKPNLPTNTVDLHLKEGKAAGLGLAHYVEGLKYSPLSITRFAWWHNLKERAAAIFRREFP